MMRFFGKRVEADHGSDRRKNRVERVRRQRQVEEERRKRIQLRPIDLVSFAG
jgi:hypothetical protein